MLGRKTTSIFLIFILMVIGPNVAYAESSRGVVRVVSGDARIQRARDDEYTKLKIGDVVKVGDSIMTGRNSRVKMVMMDENVISVSEDSHFTFERYEYDPSKFEKNVVLKLAFGKLRSIVKQRYDGKDSQYIVKTPSAVANVHGTDFLTVYNVQTNETKIITFQGGVNFSMLNENGQLGLPTLVVAGKTSVNKLDKSPEPPTDLPKNELQKINDETSVREPASQLKSSSVQSSGATLLTNQDLGQCSDCVAQPVGPTLEIGGFSPVRAETPATSTCEFCERAIEDGNTTVNINLVPIGP